MNHTRYITGLILSVLLVMCGCEEQEDTSRPATTVYPSSGTSSGGGVGGEGGGAGDELPGGGGVGGDSPAGAGGQPTVNISSPTVTEGNAGDKNLVFSVTLSARSDYVVSARFTPGGKMTTVSIPSDVTVPAAGIVIFSPGETSHTITCVVHGDTAIESDETVGITLFLPENCVLGNASGIGRILDDD